MLLPVGELTKHEVRQRANALGLRTAAKPDSQDVCFITSAGGRREFLGDRMSLHPGRVVDTEGRDVGAVDAVELVTIGQRRGLGAVAGERSYAINVDVAGAVVTIGRADDLLTGDQQLGAVSFVGDPFAGDVLAQCSAHGEPRAALLEGTTLVWTTPQRRVAPGRASRSTTYPTPSSSAAPPPRDSGWVRFGSGRARRSPGGDARPRQDRTPRCAASRLSHAARHPIRRRRCPT